MCRMVLLWGNFSGQFRSIFKSLSDVAQDDPLLRKGSKTFSHKDGWGYLNVSGESIELRRFAAPLNFKVRPPSAKDGVALIHARAAAKGEGMGILNAHPFHSQDETYDVYITHNGWFDKYMMNKALGLESVTKMNDTEVFLKLIMNQNGPIDERVKAALELSKRNDYMKGGANIYVAGLKRGTSRASIIYHTDTAPEREYGEYNKLYFIEGKNWSGVISSSIKLSKYFPKGVKIGDVERGKVYVTNVNLSN